MTYKFNNVYIKDTFTIGGLYESEGPLKKTFDKLYDHDMYYGEKSFEKAEIKLLKDGVKGLLKKVQYEDKDVDLIVSGDLENQIAASDYMARDFDISFLGLYNACATSGEGLIVGSTFIDSKKIKRCIVATSSHNMVAEKQFRNPTEYGTPKHKTATFTVTGSASILLTNEKNKIKVESATIGKVVDLGITDVNHMGAVMAPAAGDTIYNHLMSLGRNYDYYDLILTGDLGFYGKQILIDYMKKQYKMDISSVYNDCGTIIYDLEKQPVLAGGSGPVCSALVGFGYYYQEMLKQNIKKILYVPTGALFSPTMTFQKESIPAIAHAIGLEVVSK